MSDLKLEGKLIVVKDTEQVTTTFSKREFVIETDEQYAQLVKFELINTKCSEIDAFKIGDSIIVHFNVRGRKWTNPKGEEVYFVSLNAWRLENVGSSAAAPNDIPPPTADDIPPMEDGMDDGLPF